MKSIKTYAVAVLCFFCAGYLLVTSLKGAQAMFTLESTSFSNGGQIPEKYTCHGDNISPELHWSTDIVNVGSYVLIVDDPDAKRVMGRTFVHWIVYMPSNIEQLPEGAASHQKSLEQFDAAVRELRNDGGKTVYTGPCPPAGSGVHTYRFTLFAMKDSVEHLASLDLKAPFTAEQFEQHMGSSILGQTRITGKYETK